MSFFPNPITAAGSTTPRTLGVRFGEVFNVKDFGAKGDGTTNDQAAIQAAIVAAKNASTGALRDKYRGATVYFPKGTYRISSAVTLPDGTYSGIKLVGDGRGSTIIAADISSGDAIVIGDKSTVIECVEIHQMSFYSIPFMSAGSAMIRLVNTFSSKLSYLFFGENPQYPAPRNGNAWNPDFDRMDTCIIVDGGKSNTAGQIEAGFQQYIDNTTFKAAKYGISVGVAGSGLVQDTVISNCLFADITNTGILLVHAGGVYISDTTALFCEKGLSTYPSTGQVVMWVWMSNTGFDTSVDRGCTIISNGGIVQGIQITNGWFSNNGRWPDYQFTSGGGQGLWIATSQVSGIIISNATVLSNKAEGILIQESTGISINNPLVSGNSAQTVGSTDGIVIFSGSDISINGGMSGRRITSQANSQRYGVRVDTLASNYQVIGMNLRTNLSGGLLDLGSGLKVVANNLS